MQDPTFGGNPQWVSQGTLDEESSGYFLVPARALATAGWRPVPDAEGETVWGKGPPQGFAPGGTGPNDPNTGGGGGSSRPGKKPKPPKCGGPGSPGDGGGGGGMAGYDIFLQTASLHLTDTPLGYAPPVGPSIFFNLTYAQQEDNQTATLTFANFGSRWNFDWITTLTFDSDNAYVACGDGGIETFPNFTSPDQTSVLSLEAISTLVSAGNNVYQEVFSDGSMKVFGMRRATARRRPSFKVPPRPRRITTSTRSRVSPRPRRQIAPTNGIWRTG